MHITRPVSARTLQEPEVTMQRVGRLALLERQRRMKLADLDAAAARPQW